MRECDSDDTSMSTSSWGIHHSSSKTTNTLSRVRLNSLRTVFKTILRKNSHGEHCSGIPAILDKMEVSYHRDCWQKFTYAERLLKRKNAKHCMTTRKVCIRCKASIPRRKHKREHIGLPQTNSQTKQSREIYNEETGQSLYGGTRVIYTLGEKHKNIISKTQI